MTQAEYYIFTKYDVTMIPLYDWLYLLAFILSTDTYTANHESAADFALINKESFFIFLNLYA